MEERPSIRKAKRLTLLNVGTGGVIFTWLAAAGYAMVYLLSH